MAVPWYQQYIDQVFTPPPPISSTNNGQQNTQGNGAGRGFWNGGFMDRMADGFGNFLQRAAQGRQNRNRGFLPLPWAGSRPMMPQPQNPFAGMTGQAVASPQTQAAFNGVPNAVPMRGNPNVYVHPETAAAGFAPTKRPMRLIGDPRRAMRSTNGY